MSSPSLALPPARRLSDLLSSGTGSDDKAKRKAMEQQARSDEDQQLVARTQAGEAAAFDQLVVKYTPRLYGLVYNMTSNHEDTNDLLQDVFCQGLQGNPGISGQILVLYLDSLDCRKYDPQFPEEAGSALHLSLDDVDASIQNDKEFLELTATSSPVREADLSELQRRLNEAMMKLSDEHRAVVTMFHIQGMPHAEISKISVFPKGRLFPAFLRKPATAELSGRVP